MRQKLVVISFIALLVGMFAFQLIMPDNDVSTAERRTLAGFPELSFGGVYSGEFMTALDKYTLDQFPFRDGFRTIKALFSYNLLGKRDNNNVYIVDGNAFKLEYPLRENAISNAIRGINSVCEGYLTPENRVFLSIIPDKNYFAAKENGYPAMDYGYLTETLTGSVGGVEYIDIFDCLDLGAYYFTDLHWRQERLGPVVDRLSAVLDVSPEPIESMSAVALKPFYGAYYGQAALPLAPDELIYLSSETIDNAVVRLTFNIDETVVTSVYAADKFGGSDSYDVFLHGAAAFIVIENENAATDRELVIFRDSFGSSIAPLFISAYSKITLIDLRYMSPRIFGDFIEFRDQDVLFLLSTLILNNSYSLKW